MIPYTTCMRFNRNPRVRHVAPEETAGHRQPVSRLTRAHQRQHVQREWTLLVPRSDTNQEEGNGTSTSVSVHSQDDHTLCFTWILAASRPSRPSVRQALVSSRTNYPNDEHQIECVPEIHMPKFENQAGAVVAVSSTRETRMMGNSFARETSVMANEEKKGYLLLTLRRRKSMQRSIHIDPIAILDHSYYGITRRYMQNASKWRFNPFTLDVLTGGHSLSHLMFHLFNEYNFIHIFKLDVVNLWRCFRYFEAGYHDTNPYHNSVHAADVTQAMHCFIQESTIRPHLTPLETMCALLAAVAHDLDHPGVNQQFLISTKSHLSALYKNLSVLESHHWRFAVSCLRESHIFDHFSQSQWVEIISLLQSLILATDIAQQGDYIIKFKAHLSSSSSFHMEITEHRHFILQIALKCADLGNPCRPWALSKRWSEQICNEFYRQGDYERTIDIPITPFCNRYAASIAGIQTDFFRNIVNPLFELWDQFLSSPLSRQLMINLRYNNQQWIDSVEGKKKKEITRTQTFDRFITAKKPLPMRSKSLNDITNVRQRLTLEQLKELWKTTKKCINGCNTPPNLEENTPNCINSNINESKVLWDFDVTEELEEEEEDEEHISQDMKMPQAFPLPSHASLFLDKKHFSGRRGSAPGCIGIYTSCELAAAAALVFLHGAVASEETVRRSSFPIDKKVAAKNTANGNNGAKLNWSTPAATRGKSLEMLVSSLAKNKGIYSSTSAHSKILRRQACSLDSGADSPALQWFYNGKPRRGSVPQEILIESLSNYPTHTHATHGAL